MGGVSEIEKIKISLVDLHIAFCELEKTRVFFQFANKSWISPIKS